MARLPLLGLALLVVARAGMWDTYENVASLSLETFDAYLDAHPLVLVEFYMPVRVPSAWRVVPKACLLCLAF